MGLRDYQSPVTLPNLTDRKVQVRTSILVSHVFLISIRRLHDLLSMELLVLRLLTINISIVKITSLPESTTSASRGKAIDLFDDLEWLTFITMMHNEYIK